MKSLASSRIRNIRGFSLCNEVLMGQLIANKLDVEHESKKNDANIVVVNTCGFIDNAKEESVNTILEQIMKNFFYRGFTSVESCMIQHLTLFLTFRF